MRCIRFSSNEIHFIKRNLFNYLFSITVLPNTRTLRITSIIVPPFVDVRDVVMLSCSYTIGEQTLNSVKWYKNGREFYRLVEELIRMLEYLIFLNQHPPPHNDILQKLNMFIFHFIFQLHNECEYLMMRCIAGMRR